jgi:hypothetical protein
VGGILAGLNYQRDERMFEDKLAMTVEERSVEHLRDVGKDKVGDVLELFRH